MNASLSRPFVMAFDPNRGYHKFRIYRSLVHYGFIFDHFVRFRDVFWIKNDWFTPGIAPIPFCHRYLRLRALQKCVSDRPPVESQKVVATFWTLSFAFLTTKVGFENDLILNVSGTLETGFTQQKGDMNLPEKLVAIAILEIYFWRDRDSA